MSTTNVTADGVRVEDVAVPAIGDFTDIPVIEIHVSEGDVVAVDDSLVTLESDKATMDIPSPHAGIVRSLRVALGDTVNVGTTLLSVELTADDDNHDATPRAEVAQAADVSQQEPSPAAVDEATSAAARSVAASVLPNPAAPAAGAPPPSPAGQEPHAGPGVRRLARELDVELSGVTGTGAKGRITKEDLRAALSAPSGAGGVATGGAGIPEVPSPDYAQFGPVHTVPLPRITRLSGPYLHRSWLNVPHVTHNDDADITRLEAYRTELDADAKTRGQRVTLLSFLLKASAAVLREYPQVNASLSADKTNLVLKSYYHVGVAVDTPEGLVVPVLRDVDRKGILELSAELGELSAQARAGKLAVTDMQGASFTISSLGGIGGTSFTPIVNAPEVAILGVVRARTVPVWNGKKFRPRLMLPMSFSYDHRVIDGALAARFTRSLCHRLEDVRRLLL